MAIVEVPTHEELRQTGENAALIASDRLNSKTFSPGYMWDILNGLSAAQAEQIINIALLLFRKTYIRTAEGIDLDTLAEDHYGLFRQSGIPAIGEVVFSRPSTTPGNILIEAETRVATADGVEFFITADTLMTGLSITAPIQAVVVGETGIVNADTVVVIVDALTDSTISVTNPEVTAGGIAAELDPAFRERIRGFFATLRRGTKAALAFGALQVPGVAEASVDDSSYPPSVFIADITGGSNTALINLVVEELENWRAAGIQVNVFGATVILQDIDLTLSFAAGGDTSQLRDDAIAAVLLVVNSLAIGETLTTASIIAAAKITGITNVVVNDPAGDVIPAADELIRTERSRITV